MFKFLPIVFLLLLSSQAFSTTPIEKMITRLFVDKKSKTRKSLIVKELLKGKKDHVSRKTNLAARRFLIPVLKKRMKRLSKMTKEAKNSLIPNRNYDRKIFKIPSMPYNKKFQRDPAILYFPKNHNKTKPTPLVISLHAYSGGEWISDYYLPLKSHVTKTGYILAVPSGTNDKDGNQFWNGTDVCCDWNYTKVDDVGYLMNLISRLKEKNNISKVVLIGHSNGAFMAHRFACDSHIPIAGIISWGGANYYNPNSCNPIKLVNILHLHGNKDKRIPFNGLDGSLPSAQQVVNDWGKRLKCKINADSILGPINLEVNSNSRDSKTIEYISLDKCANNKKVIFGIVKGGNHIKPIDKLMIQFIMDLTLKNDFNLRKYKFPKEKILNR